MRVISCQSIQMSVLHILLIFGFFKLCLCYKIEQIDIKTTNAKVFSERNDSMFGYSLTLHSGKVSPGRDFSGQPTIFVGAPEFEDNGGKGGRLFECVVDGSSCTAQSIESVPESWERRNNQWLGATTYSNGNKEVVTCAPRFTEYTTNSQGKEFYYLIGKCVVLEGKFQNRITERTLYPCRLENGRNNYDYCQAGFSASLKKNQQVVMGAVMFNKRGNVVFEASKKKYKWATFPAEDGNFYNGYSVTTGNFFALNQEAIASGYPRFGYSGQVRVYRENLDSTIVDIFPPKKVQERNEFIFFGASVCGIDVNADGFSDLLVGAPFFSDRGDEGRVYVYLSVLTQNRILELSPNEKTRHDPGLRGSNTMEARFGWSITRAGDLNNDGILDFIIGAPQDQPDIDGDGFGNGAIYIYHGRRDGIFNDYQQKITAETVKKFYPNFQQFGYSVAAMVDTNNDLYPDIAVGAWKSDRVLLLRTRPIMNLDVSLTLSRKEILVENYTVFCPNSSIQCLDVTVCFQYIGKSVSGPYEIQYQFDLDYQTWQNFNRRVYFNESGNEIYSKRDKIRLPGKNVTSCVEFTHIHVKENNLVDRLRLGANSIGFKINYSLILPPNCENTTLCPVLDTSKGSVRTEQATIIVNCTDNECNYDLKTTISVDENEIIIGETNSRKVTVELSSSGEVAYNPTIALTHDPSLQYEDFDVSDRSFRIVPDATLSRPDYDLFQLQGPLDPDQKVTLEITYSTTAVVGKKKNLEIFVRVNALSGSEINDENNNANISMIVKRNVRLQITGTTVPKSLDYPEKGPDLNIIDNDYSSVNITSIGPPVTITVEVANQGQSDLEDVKLRISVPLTEKTRNSIIFCILSVLRKEVMPTTQYAVEEP
ncbi:integrin alpha-4-like [Xenia sp. Carnegie-2017]|uniref:integrin alpha-4-like n=1 Tax=Xenia sp. Carnegie-2017 TaxID=2897299 RepID=UPI001F046A74|nr:integrin alpha-4-like [Xenia sp. Carnegie-2017]